MKVDKVDNKKLLVTRNDKRYWKICRYISKNEELDRGISREVNSE